MALSELCCSSLIDSKKMKSGTCARLKKKLDRKGGDYLIVQHGYLIGGHPVMHHGAAKVFDKYGRL